MSEPTAIAPKSAIEALRAGVPNRAAIRLLGSDEDALRQDFLVRLGECAAAQRDGRQVEGMILEGAFGAGKSHQLGYFSDLALRENFIVSSIPISKETPLFDPGRLFAAMVRTAVVPNANDDLMTAVMGRLGAERAEQYDELELWATREVRDGRLSPLFAALLYLIPRRQTDPDDHARMARFFGGGRLTVTDIRTWLRNAGAGRLFDLKPVREAALAVQRIRFAPALLRAAGFEGWCLLLDEVELIARYSRLQRGRSYAELARWLGLDPEQHSPGIVTVAAVSDDLNDDVFVQKRDDELVPPLLEERGSSRQSAMAKKGIEWLRHHKLRLQPPDQTGLRRSLDKVARLYRNVYGWQPPETDIGQLTVRGSMRQHVKSWITTWDIERLYGQTPQIMAETMAPDYTESPEFERAPDNSGEDDNPG